MVRHPPKRKNKNNFNTPSSRQRLILPTWSPLLPDRRCQACTLSQSSVAKSPSHPSARTTSAPPPRPYPQLLPLFQPPDPRDVRRGPSCWTTLERPSGGIPGTHAPRVLPRQGTAWPQSMDSGSVKNGPTWPFSSSANTYISALCCLIYALLSTPPSTNRQQGYFFILEPAHHSHRLRLYHEHYVYSPIHFSGASTFPCARPVWSQTTIPR